MQKLSTRFILLGCILAVFLPVRYYAARAAAAALPQVDVSRLPRTIGRWVAVDVPMEQKVRDILETDEVLLRQYSDGAGRSVGVAIVYYADSERVALHLPESCLMGHGSRLSGRQPETIAVRGGHVPAMKLVIERGSARDFVIYYFQSGRYHTASYLDFRVRMLLNRLSGKQAGCSLVRFSASIPGDRSGKECLALLHEFIGEISGVVDDFLP